jgi:MFS family permease
MNGSGEQARRPSRSDSWWSQFPAPLRELALLRLIAAVGSGGVLYLTPMVFEQAAFTPLAVTSGLALAALAGTAGRLWCGLLLDRGLSCTVPLLLAAAAAMAGDALLLLASSFPLFAGGQLLLGLAAGLYWPAIELAVPLTCHPLPSARAFALVRTADAAGVALGALIGALLALAQRLRGIYAVDIAVLLVLVALLLLLPLPQLPARPSAQSTLQPGRWLPPLLPLLVVALLATAVPALMQSALPLDLLRGGLHRPALEAAPGALLIGLQLALLLLLQWPVGRALARRPVTTGLAVSLIAMALGALLLAVSVLVPWGLALVLLALLPLALGEAAFLPVATEAVVRLTPPSHRGVAMALFSQCFAISAVLAPLLAGWLLEQQRHGGLLWLLLALGLLAALAAVRALARQPALS